MARTIYKTEGIVLSKKDFSEAGRLFSVFTKDFGKIKAAASGVRYLKSKLRYNLDLFYCTRLGIVAGRDFWRIVDADSCGKTPLADELDSESAGMLARLFLLVDRMVQGEQKDSILWNIVKKVYFDIIEKKFGPGGREKMEIDAALKILSALGYLDKSFFLSKREAVSAINKAIRESML